MGKAGGGPREGKNINDCLRVSLVDGLEDSPDGGARGEDIVDDEPMAGRIGEEGGSIDVIKSLELFFAAGF